MMEHFQRGGLVMPFVWLKSITYQWCWGQCLNQKLSDAATYCFIALMDPTFQGETWRLGGIQGATLWKLIPAMCYQLIGLQPWHNCALNYSQVISTPLRCLTHRLQSRWKAVLGCVIRPDNVLFRCWAPAVWGLHTTAAHLLDRVPFNQNDLTVLRFQQRHHCFLFISFQSVLFDLDWNVSATQDSKTVELLPILEWTFNEII